MAADYEVVWAASAVAGLVDAIEYIGHDSPSYAASLAIKADIAGRSLTAMPNRGTRVAELDDPNVRELAVGNHRLIYRVRPHRVTILAFIHSARDLAALLEPSSDE